MDVRLLNPIWDGMSDERKPNGRDNPSATKPKPATEETDTSVRSKPPSQPEGEVGGPEGPEPTRYGDWEVGGRCSDF